MDAIFAVGGDGTVHEVAKRLIGGPMALGVVATGSGNGFARHLRLPLEVAGAVDVAFSGHIETIDTAEANGDPFIGFMGVGFDAWIAERFASSSVRGLRTYVREVLEGYLSYKSDRYRIVIDGTESHREAILIAVANTSQYGNNARIAPRASACDGLLDVVVVRSISLLRAPLLLTRLFHGSFDQLPDVESFRASELTIERSGAAPVHLDGEPLLMPSKVDVRVRPSSLRVVLPRGVEDGF